MIFLYSNILIIIKIVVLISIFCSFGKATDILNDVCNGGVFDLSAYNCDCTGLSRNGGYCDDPLQPGLILIPGGRNPSSVLEMEKMHAVVKNQIKEGWILYNDATNTVIGILDNVESAVRFDPQAVETICSIPSDACNLTDQEILIRIHEKIECQFHSDKQTTYRTCSTRTDVTKEATFIRILDINETPAYWNHEIWGERCSIPPNIRNVTEKRLIDCTTSMHGKRTVFVPLEQPSISIWSRVASGFLLGIKIGIVVGIAIGIVIFFGISFVINLYISSLFAIIGYVVTGILSRIGILSSNSFGSILNNFGNSFVLGIVAVIVFVIVIGIMIGVGVGLVIGSGIDIGFFIGFVMGLIIGLLIGFVIGFNLVFQISRNPDVERNNTRNIEGRRRNPPESDAVARR